MTMRHAVALVPALTLATLALAACGSGAPPPGSGSAPATPATVTVVASTNVYGSIASAVGGDAVDVRSIIDSPDADPHEYESTPADATAINAAKIVILNGADYDPFAEELVDAAGTKPTTIDVSDLSGLEAEVPAGEEFNEHVWYSLPTVEKLADRVATDLGTVDAASASTFTTNAAAFNAQVDGLMSELEAIKATHGGAKVAITEPVPVYLIEAAGLQNVMPEEYSESVEEGVDAPPAVVADALALFEGPDRVRVLFANTQTEDAATQQVVAAATAEDVPIVEVTETLPAGVTDYVTWMTRQIDALSTALDTTAA